MLTAFFALSGVYWGLFVLSDAIDIQSMITEYRECTEPSEKADRMIDIIRSMSYTAIALWAFCVSISYLLGWI